MINEILYFFGICFLTAGILGFFVSSKYYLLFLYLCIGVLFLIIILITEDGENKKWKLRFMKKIKLKEIWIF